MTRLTPILFILIILTPFTVFAQNVAITDDAGYTANSSAMLDVNSYTKGFLAPRMNATQRVAIASPAQGLLVFDTTYDRYYVYNGTQWVDLSSGSATGPFWSYSSPNVYLTTPTNYLGLGTSAPQHKLHVMQSVNNLTGTDGAYIDIQNNYNGTGTTSGIRLTNGTSGSPNVFKGGIYYQDRRTWNRGDLIFSNRNSADATNVSTDDARLIIKNEGSIEVKGSAELGAGDAIFHVQNANGDTVFAVYPEGVRIYVDDNPAKSTGSRGGFAVGGFSSAKTLTNEFLRVTPDSVRVYIDDEYVDAKASGSKGGFAVGGFSSAKSFTSNYLFVQDDSSRVYVNGDEGFAVDNIQTSSTQGRYMDLSPSNYFIGHHSGQKITTGVYNLFLGFQSGYRSMVGDRNTFLGHHAGYNNTNGDDNIFIGDSAGFTNVYSSDNIFIGNLAGFNTEADDPTYGSENVFIGSRSGYSNLEGFDNVYIGNKSAEKNLNGYGNVILGGYSGNANTGSNNCIIGGASYYKNTTGYSNVVVGAEAGTNNITGFGNVFIGYRAGYNETASNKLYIDNSNTTTPLIYGDFSSDYLRINGNQYLNGTFFLMQTNPGTGTTPTNYFYQGGSAGSTSKQFAFAIYDALWVTDNAFFDANITCVALTQTSDIRYKKNITPIENSLNKIRSLNGVYFNWRADEFEHKGFDPDKRQLGFIAQEVEKVIPELVENDESGYKAVNYSNITALLVEGIKEQQKLIDQLMEKDVRSKEEIDHLKAEIETIKSILNQTSAK